MVRAAGGGRNLFAAIDLADGSDPTFEYSYQRTVIPFVDAYFKVNLDRRALRRDASLRQYDEKVFDLPFFFIVRPRLGLDVGRVPSKRDGFASTARALSKRRERFEP